MISNAFMSKLTNQRRDHGEVKHPLVVVSIGESSLVECKQSHKH